MAQRKRKHRGISVSVRLNVGNPLMKHLFIVNLMD
jgi:hypothetical protein